jgi:hypothetical protein
MEEPNQIGVHYYTMAASGRVTLPKEIWQQMGHRLYLLTALNEEDEEVLLLISEARFEVIKDRCLAKYSWWVAYVAGAYDVEAVPNGSLTRGVVTTYTITIPLRFRTQFRFLPGEELAFVGMGAGVEITTYTRWQSRKRKSMLAMVRL